MKAVLEGLLFLVGEDGITIDDIISVLEIEKDEAFKLLDGLSNDYNSEERGLTLKNYGGLYKLTTKSEHKDYYNKLADLPNMQTLSNSALETLAIIAYNEPITRHEIDEMRGVQSSYVIRNLVAKDFIKEVGRSDKIGRPILYGITNEFLDYFGLDSKDKLPDIETIEVDESEVDLYNSKYKEEQE